MTPAQNPALRAFQTFDEPFKARAPAPKRTRQAKVAPIAAKPNTQKAKPNPVRRTRPREKVRRLTATEQRLGRHLVVALGTVVTIMLGVSLEHLASGIREITHSAAWSACALAVAIDVGMIASEVALIVLATFPNIRVADYAHRYVVSTIVISMALNV